MYHLLSTKQFKCLKELNDLFRLAEELRTFDSSRSWCGKVMTIMKDEASTRTRCSFEAAMKRLGGEVIVVDLDATSSAAKGESLEDTARVLSSYSDVLVARLRGKGDVERISRYSSCPVINAGDGNGEHPTQALLDAYTLWRHWRQGKEKKRRVLLTGDLEHSRTIHSLIYLLGLDPGIEMHALASINNLPDDCWKYIQDNKLNVCTVSAHFENVLVSAKQNYGEEYDAVYMTRYQNERYNDKSNVPPPGYPRLTPDKLPLLGENTLILHPLPRGPELPEEIDKDKRAVYFEQAKNGMYVRMALLINTLKQGASNEL